MGKRSDAERDQLDALRKEVGARLRLVREILGLRQGEFARRAEMSPSAYNQIENGQTVPSIVNAISLRRAHGLTLDYIYCGDPSDLPVPLRRALEAMELARDSSSE